MSSISNSRSTNLSDYSLRSSAMTLRNNKKVYFQKELVSQRGHRKKGSNEQVENRVHTAASSQILTSVVADAEIVRRAALDIGSGKISVTLVDFDVKNNKIRKKVLQAKERLDVTADLEANNKTISAPITLELKKIFESFKALAEKNGAKELVGVATAAFRLAENGKEVIEKLSREVGMPIYPISQQKEAELGWHSAASSYPEIAREQVVSFDCGNGSFQLALEDGAHLQVFEGPMGITSVNQLLVEKVRGQKYSKTGSLCPVSSKEISQLISEIQTALPRNDTFQVKLQDKLTHGASFIGIGGQNSLPGLAMQIIKSTESSMTLEQIETALQKLSGMKSDDPFMKGISTSNQDTVVTRIALLAAVMKKFGLEKIYYKPTEGITGGLFFASEYWQK